MLSMRFPAQEALHLSWVSSCAASATWRTVVDPMPVQHQAAPADGWLFVDAADIISAIEFDGSGQHLATGDRGGRVVLFERVASPQVLVMSCAHL